MSAGYITTIRERCRVCYTCVRECPAKAIRIEQGQAEIVAERCISCGNCVRVCGKRAKQIVSSIDTVEKLLSGPSRVVVCLAPSFPAEFPDVDHRQLVGMLRSLGFASVHEVSFGADLVAAEYTKLLSNCNGHRYISSSCPAIVGYVERYHPELVDSIAPIVSPMIALARYLRSEAAGTDLRIVFVGPCIAKKTEGEDGPVRGEVDAVLTFSELRELFERRGVESSGTAASDFDPPRGGTGALYPISRGALQASGIQEDLLTDEIIATQGQHHVREAISQFAAGNLSSKLLELLCCEGCIMGAGMTATLPLFLRRRCVQKYVTQQLDQLDEQQWNHDLRSAAQLPLHRDFTARDQRIGTPPEGALKDILRRLGKPSPDDELNCGACGYETCREHAVAIHLGLAENEMCLPHTIDQLSKANQELEESHSQLASAQEALMQSEKLASMGQLAAGIAHEVNNPLGIVLMYAHLLMDECETKDHRFADIQMIAEQADRCKNIVGGLLHFARQNKVVRYPADVKELVERVVTPMRAPAGITIELASSLQDPIADLDKDQIAQVVTNLVNNAVAAIEGEGQVTVACSGDESTVEIAVTDTGSGIPKKIVKKIFEPFFTTKQAGKGTGLGLSVSYGIVKMHCGDIRVESNADADAGPTGTKFTIRLPRFE